MGIVREIGEMRGCHTVVKRPIVFGYAHGYSVSETAEFVEGLQRVFKQWCTTNTHEPRQQECGQKKILKEGPVST